MIYLFLRPARFVFFLPTWILVWVPGPQQLRVWHPDYMDVGLLHSEAFPVKVVSNKSVVRGQFT